ncbi:MAG TPA: type II toxin-antitoxin system HicA family toxin [Candidatus Thermoplasmatota archaeon]|nr:type II toxin-antitoxin system HicA family toxin [Candidatus Thermoplasmatota archaeon]
MTGLRPVPARKPLRALGGFGFHLVSQRGSHVKLRHANGRTVIVPVHPSRDIKVGLLRRILDDAGISSDEFLQTL